jgi:hypothetical protein
MDAEIFERFRWMMMKGATLDEIREYCQCLVASFTVYGDPHGWENFDGLSWPCREMLTNNYMAWTSPPSEPTAKEPWQQ